MVGRWFWQLVVIYASATLGACKRLRTNQRVIFEEIASHKEKICASHYDCDQAGYHQQIPLYKELKKRGHLLARPYRPAL